MAANDVYIGIDLGTTYCCIAFCSKNGAPDVLTDERNNRVIPSCITYSNGQWMAGRKAVEESKKMSATSLRLLKRTTGRTSFDGKLRGDLEKLGFTNPTFAPVSADPTAWQADGDIDDELPMRPLFKIGEGYTVAEEFAARLLKHLVQIAEKRLGEPISGAVITVPADYVGSQRESVMTSAKIAGLKVLRLINEPTAAIVGARAAGTIDDGKVLVFDIGGGTTDISLVVVQGNTYCVKGTKGHQWLGGEDINGILIQLICKTLRAEPKKGRNDKRFREACEMIKRNLGDDPTLNLDSQFLQLYFPDSPAAEVDEVEILREEFDEACQDFYQNVYDLADRLLKDTETYPHELTTILMVGGSAGLVGLQCYLEKQLPNTCVLVPPGYEEVVAKGAALVAASETDPGKRIVLTEVLAHSIGIQINDGSMVSILHAGDELPGKSISGCDTFANGVDYQEEMRIAIYEGEGKVAAENTYLGAFIMSISPMPAGKLEVEVTVTANMEGLVHVTAKECKDGAEPHSINISREGSWSEETIFNLRLKVDGGMGAAPKMSTGTKRKLAEQSDLNDGEGDRSAKVIV
ncbi:heat shock protein 70 family [Podospora didyma]|uniref:Heat shock protein 70 family n=1 Tax=Podospora didyma TaxID=330526 RepID=A0AAE0U551_9PEZI|nr:heat shock protein 70 family [Podospora didyma]